MKITASIDIGGQTITGAHEVVEHHGELYLAFQTTDQGSYAALKIDPGQVHEMPAELGLAIANFYKGHLSLADVIVIPKDEDASTEGIVEEPGAVKVWSEVLSSLAEKNRQKDRLRQIRRSK